MSVAFRHHLGVHMPSALEDPSSKWDDVLEQDGQPMPGTYAQAYFRHLMEKTPGLLWFACGECDRQGPDGRCLGHPLTPYGQDDIANNDAGPGPKVAP